MNAVSVFDRLSAAAKTGEEIAIVYHGGSQPGAVRTVFPVRVTEREMRAREVESGKTKTFLVAKIEFPDSVAEVAPYVPDAAPPEEMRGTIREVLEASVEELAAIGWHVALGEEACTLHRYFKNGKPRKGADVSLTKFSENPHRPYYVRGPSLATARTFGRLASARELFLREAHEHAPDGSS